MKIKTYLTPEITVISMKGYPYILAGSDPTADNEMFEEGDELIAEEGEHYFEDSGEL